MGGRSSKAINQFEKIKGTFQQSLNEESTNFQRDVFTLVMGPIDAPVDPFKDKVKPENLGGVGTSQTISKEDAQVNPSENNELDIKVKDRNGNDVDPKHSSQHNRYISIYDKDYMNIYYTNNSDFSQVKDAIDSYSKDLETLVTEASGVATGSPLDIIKSLFTQSNNIVSSIGSIIKTSLNLAAVNSSVGIQRTIEKTFIPGGIYVCNLIYNAKTQVEDFRGTTTCSMILCRTIIATSTELINTMRDQQLIAQQLVLMSKLSLDVVRKQGEIIGWSDVYPSYQLLTLARSKSKFIEVQSKLQQHLDGLPWKSTQAPVTKDKDLTNLSVYAAILEDYKNYGVFMGTSQAKDIVQSLVEGTADDKVVDAVEFVKSAKDVLKELKTNSKEDYDQFYNHYISALDKLRDMIR